MNPFKPDELKIAVIGGGTGSFTLLTELKNYTSQIVALVNMADDGGSTGTLRDEYGALPPGDVRQCLIALSRVPDARDLFNYRFESGSMRGHAFGNLFLTALEQMTGDFSKGVELAGSFLNIVGRVEPITLDNIRLVMENHNGKIVKGEDNIGKNDFRSCRPKMWLDPKAKPNPIALSAIENANLIVIAPGNLYGSLAPALLVSKIGRALKNSKAKKVYVCNLMTKPGQTDNFGVTDFADEIERLAGGNILDAVLYNTECPSDDLIKKYAHDNELPVKIDKENFDKKHYVLYGANLLSGVMWEQKSKNDPLASSRTFIRHDSSSVALSLKKIYKDLSK